MILYNLSRNIKRLLNINPPPLIPWIMTMTMTMTMTMALPLRRIQ